MTDFITRSGIQEISLEEAVLSVTSQTTIPTAAMMLTLQMAQLVFQVLNGQSDFEFIC